MSILLDFLFPRYCFGCGRSRGYLCPACLSRFRPHALKSPPPPFEGYLSLYPYHPPLSTVIKALKFDFVTDLAPFLAQLAAADLHANFPNLVDYWRARRFVIMPIPLHPRRLNWRGFNQSQLISELLARHLGLAFSNHALIRTRPTLPQSTLGSNSSVRLANVTSCFALNQPPPSSVILFDDVSTTGSTLASAASVFPQATRLWALTLASKL
jgi:ComF family protein